MLTWLLSSWETLDLLLLHVVAQPNVHFGDLSALHAHTTHVPVGAHRNFQSSIPARLHRPSDPPFFICFEGNYKIEDCKVFCVSVVWADGEE